MRVFLAGSGPYGAGCLSALLRLDGVEIVGIASPPDPDDLSQTAYDTYMPSSIPLSALSTAVHTVRLLTYLKTDLLVLANVDVITPMEVINAPRYGSLCFHPSLLPRWRGRNAVKAALVAGDKETGVTIFRPNSRADAGPIVWQRKCAIPDGVSAGRLYYGTLVPLGIDAMVHAVASVRDGLWLEHPQLDLMATYDRDVLTAEAAD